MQLNETELKTYVLEHIGSTSESTLDIINNTRFVFSKKKPANESDRDLKVCIDADYDNNVFYINNTYSLSDIMLNIKRCVFYHPEWLANYSRESQSEWINLRSSFWNNANYN